MKGMKPMKFIDEQGRPIKERPKPSDGLVDLSLDADSDEDEEADCRS